MNIAIFKSLDKENTLFGLVGNNIRYTALGIGIACALGLGIGSKINSLIGFMTALVLSGCVYLGMIVFQNKFSNKERTKWLCSHKLADYVVAQPVAFRNYVYKRCHDDPAQRVTLHLPSSPSPKSPKPTKK